ncbi:FAD-dependent 5-carboxymethylaminomethyl-2-thiouridine(34) oxidoreductase MnmC [Variovorax sp. LT2P21]|uniref:FAD-dependent 5-carboxymethylaminomethyl-2-thiouridine(34) oxidoreductase MnmC n=1 Tax=Variovorax sp. LT2P21 TaxID=3443731 RepID=UPI003F4665A8
MAEPVAWRADGVPGAWAGRPQWRVLQVGFGVGLHFLAAWQAWRDDAQRPRMLHVVAIEAQPVSRDELLRAVAVEPQFSELGALLAAQWHGLLPGFHRLSFDDGHVLLTLCIGEMQTMLRGQRFEADSILLNGHCSEQDLAEWSPDTLKAVSRFARLGTRIASSRSAQGVRDALAQNGFTVRESAVGGGLEGEFAPAWTLRRRTPVAEAVTPGHCAVIGAGLAGAAVAASLARRGWRVTVLDAAERPATGASGVPAAVFAPHVSADDALLSRLTRAGLRLTLQQLHDRLEEGVDWRASGVVERRAPGDDRLPAGWSAEGPNASWRADAARLRSAGLPDETTALWHAGGGWAKPARLVAAWLAQPGVTVRCGARVERIEGIQPGVAPTGWRLFDGEDQLLAEADGVVIAAGFDSAAHAPRFALQPVRGQVAWGRMVWAPDLPTTPLNGDGHLIAHVPDADGAFWLAGATFDRDRRETTTCEADKEANRARLARLHPGAAAMLDDAFSQGQVQAWAGVRCASHDRRPLVGPCDAEAPQGPWLCSALGSRGLSFAVLCAELLAARWHAEPLPVPAALAAALDTQRAAPRARAQTHAHGASSVTG